jgi:putative tricarboxylic transport membrane protein
MMVVFAFVALIGRMLSYPMAPLLLGFILGGLLEDNLVRSLEIYNGSLAFLYQRPVTLAINMATLCFLIMPAIQLIKSRKKTSVKDTSE